MKTLSSPAETSNTFFHPKPERFAEICQRFFPYVSYHYNQAHREVPMPALLSYARLSDSRKSILLPAQRTWNRALDLHASGRLLVFLL
jgi:hypothetical protein